jgi:molecular chaperone GrpE
MKHKAQDDGGPEGPKPGEKDVDKVVESLRGELEAERKVSGEYKELLQRLQADFENHIKRSEASRSDLVKTSNRDLILKLLDILDTMDYALNAKPSGGDGAKMMDGFRKVGAQLKSVLAAEGLEEVDAAGAFDHVVHEAVDAVDDASKPAGTILDVVQKGYTLNGKLIRPSKVVVVKNRGECDG